MERRICVVVIDKIQNSVVKKAQDYAREGKSVFAYVPADKVFGDLFGPKTTIYLIGQEIRMLNDIYSLMASSGCDIILSDANSEAGTADQPYIVDIMRWAVSAIIKMNNVIEGLRDEMCIWW